MKWKLGIGLTAISVSAVALELLAGVTPSWQPDGALAAPGVASRLVAAAGLVEPASEARQLEGTMVGRLVAMNVAEGDHVAAGDIIAEIENADLKAQLAEAQATLAVRENELKRLLTGARPQEIDQLKAALRQAEASAAEARSNFDRQTALEVKKITSEATVEQALASRDTSDARRALAAAQLSLLIAPPRVEDAAIARANVDAARAKIEEIKAEIEKTIIRSPIDGTILKLYRRKGETVTNLPPTPIVTVGDTRRLRVRADIDQTDVANVAVGQTAWITADAYGDRRFRGTVVRLGAQLGRKNFHTDAPNERVDTKILDVLIDLEPGARLPIGLPVDVVLDRAVKPAPQLESKGQPQPPLQPEQHASATALHETQLQSDQAAMTMQALPVAWVQVTESPPHSDAPARVTIRSDNAMVQIGSYNTAALAKSAWDRFRADHGQLANGFDADVREANLGDRGVKYRLRFGPFPNSAATARCKALEQQGAACLVTPF